MLRNVGHSGLRGFGGSPRSGAARRPDGRRRSTFLQLTGAVLFLEPQTLEQRLFDRRRPLRERTPPGGQSIPVIISSQKYCSIVLIFLGVDPVERLAPNSEKILHTARTSGVGFREFYGQTLRPIVLNPKTNL